MGDIADAMIEGFLDCETGEYLDGEAPGYPRTRNKPKGKHKKGAGNFKCDKCGRYFKSQRGVNDHTVGMHTPEGQERRQRQILGLK